jgi:GNAT superfamily N-acetyltransferase
MALATWWTGDPLMKLTPLHSFKIQLAHDDKLLAQLNRLSMEEVRSRMQAGHRPYLGYLGHTAVTYGWVATREASIGELNLVFSLAAGERYLWDFATLPEWQGRGLYPRLLQAIIQSENAERLWIIHAPENLPSGAGIHKAGFEAVGQLSFRPDGSVGLIPLQNERAAIGGSMLGVPLFEDGLSPCWGCIHKLVCECKLNPEQCTCAVAIQSHA